MTHNVGSCGQRTGLWPEFFLAVALVLVCESPQRGRRKASPALQRRETEQLVNKAPDGGDAESRHFPRHAPYGWGIGLRNEGRGVFVGGHFTFGEASPPLGNGCKLSR